MYFGSDNWAGAPAPVVEAIAKAAEGFRMPYGNDDISERAQKLLNGFFGREVDVFYAGTGSASNALALSVMQKHAGVVLCHEGAHVACEEGIGPEMYTGMKLVGVKGANGRMTGATLNEAMAYYKVVKPHHGRPVALSLTQATELGTTYCPMDIAALSSIARRNGLKVHMDGARFCNAVVAQEVVPAALTHQAGVDLLAFGLTKNGALCAEMVISFDPAFKEDLFYRQKQMGQTFSKNRLMAAQVVAMLENDLWRELATHANGMAVKLSEAIESHPACRIAVPTEINEVFAVMPVTLADELMAGGAAFYPWDAATLEPENQPGDGEGLYRLICSFATTDDHIGQFADRLGALNNAA